MKSKKLSLLAVLLMVTIMVINTFAGNGSKAFAEETTEEETTTGEEIKKEKRVPIVVYKSHVQKVGDTKEVKNGETTGVIGESKRMEAVWIEIRNLDYEGGITYQSHIQKNGWEKEWVKDGEMSGTHGEAKRVEAIKINLYGELSEYYDVYYRVYAQKYGWLDWAKNGAAAGTASQALRLEGLQVKLVPKSEDNYLCTACSFIDMGKTATGVEGMVNYKTHVQKDGDQKFVCDGSFSGTSGESKRLEALYIKLGETGYTGGVKYQSHVQSYGWEKEWAKDGSISGTQGKAKRLEGIKIQLYGEVSKHYDIYYRVHVQSYGWLGWAKNGETAGTEGLAKRLESMQIILVKKNTYSELFNNSTTSVSFLNGSNLGNLSYSERIMLISGGYGIRNVSKSQAESWQKTITVPTWDFESSSSMTKVTKYRQITVNKAIADYVYRIFLEIYNSADKPVIDSTLYAFSYRANVNNPSVLSQHSFGCAIDINTIVNPNGMAGRSYEQWKAMPETTIAEKQTKAKAIYKGSTIVKVFTKYGLTWGGYSWKDAMHFDYIDY